MSRETALGPGGEFDLIRRLQERWGALAVDIGDDAAVVDVPRGERLVVSTDAAVEGIHFRRHWLSLEEIAARAVTAALSDLAAMAAAPLGVLVSLALPRADASGIGSIADGVALAVRAAGTVVRGGNISRADTLAITTTVLGSTYAPLRRDAVRAGDLLYVTGTLGGPAAALRALEAGSTPGAEMRDRFVRPAARIRESLWLARRGVVAAIDVSDGLAADAAHLAAAGDVGIELEVGTVPLVAGAAPDDVFGGEEYELLVAARAPLPADAFRGAFGVPLTLVGRAREGPAGVRVTRHGERVVAPRGHDHFSR